MPEMPIDEGDGAGRMRGDGIVLLFCASEEVSTTTGGGTDLAPPATGLLQQSHVADSDCHYGIVPVICS